MSDEDLRWLERNRDRDPEVFARWLLARVRAGVLPQENLELAAALGFEIAQQIVQGPKNIWNYLDHLPRTKHATLGLSMCYLAKNYAHIREAGTPPVPIIAPISGSSSLFTVDAYYANLANDVVSVLENYLQTTPRYRPDRFDRKHAAAWKKARRPIIEVQERCQLASQQVLTPTEGFYANMLYCTTACLTEKWSTLLPRELVSVTAPGWFQTGNVQVWDKHHLPTHLLITAYEQLIRLYAATFSISSWQNAGFSEEMKEIEFDVRARLISVLLGLDF